MTERTIQDLVLEFAGDLTRTLRRALGEQVPPFQLLVRPSRSTADEAKVVVRLPAETQGIDLLVDAQPVLRLDVTYHCSWDSSARYLRIESSSFKVFSRSSTEPLFRYDYVHTPTSDLPGAHLNVHGHHDHIVWSMLQGQKRRGKRRARAAEAGSVPGLRELHFPLGGPRFRPCLEDLVEMLICEFGVDCEPTWRDALGDGRAAWRRKQLAAAMWDDPETALAVAEDIRAAAPSPDVHKIRRL